MNFIFLRVVCRRICSYQLILLQTYDLLIIFVLHSDTFYFSFSFLLNNVLVIVCANLLFFNYKYLVQDKKKAIVVLLSSFSFTMSLCEIIGTQTTNRELN